MIPKVIHYCWFGGAPIPPLTKKCIQSWKKYCPDYTIRLWTEKDLDLEQNTYAREALKEKKWAFVSDWARLYILWKEGGIYLDTDVELIRSPDFLLQEEAFFGVDEKNLVCTGLGFGAEKEHPLVEAILRDYDGISFYKEDGTPDLTPCPDRNTLVLTKMGFSPEKGDQIFKGARFLPNDYLAPIEFETKKTHFTENTLSVHHYSATWLTPVAKRTHFFKRLLGVPLYNKIYGKFFQNSKWLEW